MIIRVAICVDSGSTMSMVRKDNGQPMKIVGAWNLVARDPVVRAPNSAGVSQLQLPTAAFTTGTSQRHNGRSPQVGTSEPLSSQS